MSSYRDATRRLQVIYDACVPKEEDGEEGKLDEFTRLRKRIHAQVKSVRQELKEREAMMSHGGTTTDSAEKSYRIRVAIRGLKGEVSRMGEIVSKDEKKKRIKDPEQMAQRKEILELCQKHIEECENLEKRRFNEQYVEQRVELLQGARPGIKARKGDSEAADPFTSTELPDIDVEEDLKKINERNKLIDDDIEVIGAGVARLKDLANDLGNELEKQNDQLDDIEKGVDTALDKVDNLNIKMKTVIDGMMKGDKFILNCILVCVLLALVAFIAGQFTT